MGLADAGAHSSKATVMAVEQKLASLWLICFGAKHPEQVRMRLFCFHYAGATA